MKLPLMKQAVYRIFLYPSRMKHIKKSKKRKSIEDFKALGPPGEIFKVLFIRHLEGDEIIY